MPISAKPHKTDTSCFINELSIVEQLSLAVGPCSYVTVPSTQLFHHKGVYQHYFPCNSF